MTGIPDQPGNREAGNRDPDDPGAVQALSNLLAVEHAAVYASAAAGGALAPLRPGSESTRVLAQSAYTAHRELRDRLVTEILDRGGTAPVAQPAYRLPVVPTELTSALGLLADVEDRCAAAAHDALGDLAGEVRALVIDALAGMAVRAQQARIAAGQPVDQATRALPGT
ncbi:hypothetical protein FDG2_5360 [Candidatus Protofrankia californiensis]|uniref:DUF4439 domain-containing protein n=1 Tax=Candidatus Protofrankia californiensis TaxID=1839754 RepID=A0A1C3PCN0_9ACTN|nr:hypothetical protein FDG2_5360 [Candidatus Protofrankia californiensis]